MAISLTDNVTASVINLPQDLLWENEHEWSPVGASTDYSLSGSLIVQQGVRSNGRPILLRSPDNSRGWVEKSVLDELKTARDLPDREFTLLTNDGQTRTVMFDHSGTPLSSDELFFVDQPTSDHIYLITLSFIEV